MMTDNEINAAIAEACGKTVCHGCYNEIDKEVCCCGMLSKDHNQMTCEHAPIPYGCTCFYNDQNENLKGHVTDYVGDLNAMHEAESALTEEQRLTYVSTLDDMVYTGGETELPVILKHLRTIVFSISTATARQRAIAFLRTIRKWKED